MNRLRESAFFDEGSRKRIWALLGAYALVALTVVTSVGLEEAFSATTPVQLANSWTTGLTHTVAGANDRLLVYVVTIESAGGDVTSVTYGGQAMTQAVEDVYTSGDGNRVEIWYLDEAGIQAASGNSFVPTYSVGPDVALHAAVTFENVDQSAPIVDTASTTGTNATLTTGAFSVVADGMAVSGTSHEGGGSYTDGAWGSGWGEGADQASGTTQGTGYTTSAYGAAGTDTATATHSSTGRHAIVAISLAPSEGADPGTASISGLAWRDTNEDAIAQPGENTYMVGATVNLYSPGPDTILGTPDDVLAGTTTTSAVGTYSFTSLDGGAYLVEVDETTLPPYWRFTGFANPTTVTIAAAEARTGVDFGYRQRNTSQAGKYTDPVGGVLPGQVITYERTWDNTGDPTETGVGFENPLPAGTTYVPGSTTVEIIPVPLFYDRFAADHYNNSNYTGTWAGPWEEVGEATDPHSGDWQIALNGTNPGLRKGGAPGASIQRLVTTELFDEGFFFLNYQRENMPVGASVEMQISATGTAGPWTTIAQIDGTGGSDAGYLGLDSVDVSSYMTGNTAIRFVHTGAAMGAGEYLWLDWIGVRGVGAPILTAGGGAPPTLTSGHTINSGERLRVTFQVTVDDPPTVSDVTSSPTVIRDSSPPWVLGSNVNPVIGISADAGTIVINEANYAATPGMNANDEFIELYNASASPVDISSWRLANGSRGVDHTFAASTTLGAGEYAVVWVGPGGSAPGASVEVWENKNPRLEEAGDSLWLWDAAGDVVDAVAWGTGSDSPPHISLWDATYQASLAGATTGQSISLTPNGTDGDASACWELTTSGDASGRCGGYLATRDTNGGAATWSVGESNNTPPGIYGTIFEDIAGNVLDGGEAIGDTDNPGAAGVTVTLWKDNPGVGLADAGDVIYVQGGLTNPATTDTNGHYSFPNLPAGDYYVVVDSKTIAPTAGLESGHTVDETWAEQTWAPEYGYGRLSPASKSWSSWAKPFYGGANDQGQWYAESDDASDVETAEHFSGVTLTAGEVRTDVDFGFSFNVVTNVLAGDNTDHDGGAARTVQGSLRQFLQNANAIAGGNAMRFVPVLPANDTSWWEVKVTEPMPSVTGANTTIDGTAFGFVDGVTVRDENAGATGYNAAGDKTVGADGIALPVIGRPEFEIEADRTIANPVEVGIHGDANGLAVRDLAIFGFGDTGVGNTDANIMLGPSGGSDYTGVVIERNLIGSGAGDFVGPIIAGTGAGVHLETANGAIVEDNLIGFTVGRTINAITATGTLIQGNELTTVSDDVMDVYLLSDLTTIEENHINGGIHWGIDFIGPNGTIRNNTVVNAGDGVGQTGGLRLFSTGHTVDRNVFTSNAGPGVLIAGDKNVAEIRPAGEAVITGNEFSGNTGLAIDLQAASDNNNLSGDGITANNGGATDITHGNLELDFPEIAGASVSGGTTTVTGTACSGCTVEIFQAVGGTGDDDPPGSGSNYHGEGIAYLGTGVAAGGAFSIDVTGLIAGDEVSATATDTGLAVTSEFSLNEAVVNAPVSISGTIFEDEVGDGLADGPLGVGANPFESGVRIEVFRDGGDNTPDGGDDIYQGFTVSALADGTYSFSGLPSGVYWVTVDSQGVYGGPLNAGFAHADTWAEQTYGPVGAASFDGSSWSFAGSAGVHYGGARADVSDSFALTASLPGAEHIARVDLTAGSQSGIDFGFGFNVVTSAEAATAAGVSGRSAQGSLDQFIRNANAVAGANAMRFVPAVAQNDGSGSWWRIDYSAAPNPLQDIFDTGTVIDGTAFAAADGVAVVDSNAGFLGANATGGVTVGTGATPLPQVAKPELEIKDEGLRLSQAQAPLLPSNAQIRDVSIWGSATSIYALAGASTLTGLVFDGNVIGAPPDAFVDPATVGANYGLRISRATGTQVTNNLIGFVDYTPLLLETNTSGAAVTGNEIRGGGRTQAAWDGLLLWGTGDTIDGNLIADNGAMGIDLNAAVGGHTIQNNTVQNSGLLGAQTAGLRIRNHDNTVRFNIFENNAGPGVSVEGGAGAALRNLISGNEFNTNGGLSIDLALLALADDLGDGVNPNDSVTNVTHGNEGLDYPVIASAQYNGTTATIIGTTCAACRVEVYRAIGGAGDSGPGGDHGEGVEYLGFTTANGAGAFTFATTLVGVADEVSAVAIDGSSNTSEFGANETVGATVAGTVFEDIAGNLVDGAEAVGDASNPGADGVTVYLYRDDGDGVPNAGDAALGSTVTSGGGLYSFSGLSLDSYWAVVDSTTIGSTQDPAAVAADTWAEQTYGPAGSWCADGLGGTTAGSGANGACFGGRRVDPVAVNPSSDELTTWHTGGEHLALVDATTASVLDADFGFSFNVLTTTRGGDTTDDDPSANRSVQGSLRQFVQNANAITVNGPFDGANLMRFVPAEPTNATNGVGRDWWNLYLSSQLPDITDGLTTIDGTAFQLSDGVTVRETNAGTFGTGGSFGVDGLAGPAVSAPELELGEKKIVVDAPNVTVRDLGMYRSDEIQVKALGDTFTVENLLMGARADFADPAGDRSNKGIEASGATGGTVRNSLFMWHKDRAIILSGTSDGWLIEQNEIVLPSQNQDEREGIEVNGSGTATIRGNLIQDSRGAGIDLYDSTGGNILENNTITGSGFAGKETFGIRVGGVGNVIDRNVIYDNVGAGVGVRRASTGNVITRNSMYGNGTVADENTVVWDQIGIDLLDGGDDEKLGGSPYRTLNDDGDGDSNANGLQNFAVIETAELTATSLILEGFAAPGATIEFFLADPEAPGSPADGYGEGQTWLYTGVEEQPADLDTGTGSYSGLVNGVDQGAETGVNRFRFQVPLTSLPPLLTGDPIVATATVAGQTSEFGGITPVADLVGLSITKSSDKGGSVLPGETIAYTITVDNVSSVDQTNVSVTDNLPAGTTWVSTTVTAPDVFTVRDTFDVVSYANNNGSVAWVGDWVEVGDDGTPSGGEYLIRDNDQEAGVELVLDISGASRSIERGVDLTGVSYAELSFDYWVYHLQHVLEEVYVDVWDGTSWTRLETFTLIGPDSGYAEWKRDITPYANANTKIRFSSGPGTTTSEGMFLNNVQVKYSVPGTPTAAGAGPTLASGHTLFPGDTLSISYQVSVNDPPTVGSVTNTAITTSDEQPFNLQDAVTDTVTNRSPVADAIADQPVDELSLLSFTATGSDPDLDGLTWSLTSGPTGAAITAGGAFTWTPTEAQGPGVHAVTVRVTDDGTPNLFDEESFSVTVGEVNLEPVLAFVGNRAVDELVNLSFAATATDPDDPANLLSFSLSGAPAGASITAGGAFSWTPTEAQGPGSYVFDVVVTETNGLPSNLSDSETITVTVGEVNLEPVLAFVGNRAVDELVNLSFTATAADPDDPANLLSFSLSGAPAGASITAGGAFSWTPTEAQGPGSYTFDVVVTETNGLPSNLSDSETITVTVGEVNLAPTLDPVGDKSVDELVNLSFTATASDPDDPANLLSFSLSGAPAGASITAGGAFSWTPTEAQGPGSYVFDVVVTETNGLPSNLSDSETITVTVGEVNLEPVLAFVGNRAVDELVNLSFTATAADPDDPANLLSFSLSGAPAGASITAGGAFSWTPTEAQGPGSYTFDVVVTETNGLPSNLSDSETITVTVGEDNLAPTLNLIGDQSVNELVNLSFTATASDPDAPVNTLLFSLSGAPVGAVIDPNTGAFSWTPTEAQGPGSYVFDVIVTDDGTPGLNDSETITVTVGEVDLEPVLDPVGDQSIDELVNLSFTATASDPDDPANLLAFSLSGAPAGASITAGGAFSWTPTEAQGPGSYIFDVVVTETNGLPSNLSDSETITVTVGEVNLEPVLDPVGDKSIAETTLLSFTATATDPDDPANLLAFSLSGAPAGASITAGGAFTWTPTEAQGPGSYTFDVVVTETNGLPTNLSDSETITVTVGEANLAPTLDPVGDKSVDELVNLSFTATASDPDDPANSLSFSLSGEPVGASITAGGAFTWTPTEAQGPGSYTFDVVVTETNGLPTNLSDTETITVTVGEVNLEPVLDPVGDQSIDELVNLSFTATASDSDDPANLLSFSLSGAPAGASITAGGAFSWTPTEAQGPGSYTFDVVVTETNGLPSNLSDSETITVTVGEVNLEPVLAFVGNRAVDELVNLSFTATAADPDDPANLLSFSLSGAPAGASITAGGAFSWTPTEAQGPGSYTFDVVVTETNGLPSNLSDSETITVTVGEVNLAPTLDPVGDKSVDELVNLSFTATASDPDDPANSLSFSLSGEPVGASITAGGAFTWTPTEAQGPGSYVFDVVVTETNGAPTNLSDSETITVTVGEVNLEPVLAFVGNRAVDELVNLSFTATAADPDTPANLLSFSLSGAPAGASITAGGAFSWTPTEAQGPGSYTFDVVVTETNGLPSNLSDSETITVTVGEVNLEPVLAFVGNRAVDELVNLSFTATAADPDDPANLLSFSLSGAPAGASITAGGAFSWTPTEAQGPGSYTFDVVVTETNGLPSNLSDSETITVTVGEVNLEPVLAFVGNRAVDELVNLSFTATAADPDDPANLLSFSLSGAPAGASITAGGAFSWTPTEAQGPGSYVFDVVVTETNGLPSNLSDSETITVTVGEVNLEPVLAFVGNRAVDELVNLSFTATAADPDDPANLLSFSLSGAPAGASITAGGAFSWTPTEAQGPGSYTFDVVVTETNGLPSNLSDSETITVTVGEDNLAPTLNLIGDQSVNELVNLSFTATASDPDAPVNTLLFSLSGAPVGAVIDPNTGAFSWTPTEAQGPGSYVFDVIVTDDGTPGLNDSETITVTVGEVDLEPVLDPVGDQSIDELVNLSFTATASDPDDPANLLAFSLSGAPAGASITAGGAFSWTPTEAQGPGSYIFDVVVTETNGLPSNLSDSETITVTVGEVNLEPVLDPVGDKSIAETTLLSFTATATDPDTPANLLAFSLSGAPAGASITAGGAFTWTPTEAQGPGSYTFDVVVTETNGLPTSLSDSETITVTVGEANLAPTLDPVGDKSVDELVNLSFTATASDPDDPANSLSFSLSGEPVGASITAGGAFTWTPTEAQGPGSYTFDVVVTETNGLPSNLSDSETITVTVGEVNLAPTLDPVGDKSVDELVNLSFTATASDPDDPANLLAFSLSGEPVGASITAGGAFSWTPTEAQGPGSYTFDVVVTETNGLPTNLSDSETITVTVGEVNVAPVADAIANQTVDELTLLSVTATGSDMDVPANNLAWSLDSGPGFVLPNGDYSWTPTEAQGPGTYTVVLRVTDDGTGSLSDTVSFDVTVNEVDLDPVLDPVGDQSVDELVNLSFTATAADPDTPANLLAFSLSGAPAGASITAGGAFTWTPTEAQGPGSYVFDVIVTETNGAPSNLSDSETITVTVGEVNLEPVLAFVGNRAVDELVNLSFAATATDPDDPANLLSFSLSGAPAGASITAGGAFTWTPTEAQGPGSYTFDVVVTETNGAPTNLSDSETITVTVGEDNLAPTLNLIGDQSVNELVNLSFTATASDPDAPVNTLLFSLSGAPVGAVIDPNTGAFSWTPTEAQGPGSYTFDVVVTDDGTPGLNDSETITVTVGEVNLAPVLDPVGDRSIDELVNLSFTATASDPDDIPANLLTFSLSGEPFGASITAGGVFSWTPAEAQGPGSYTFDVVVTETNGAPSNLSDSETITVTVGEVNTAPTASPIGDVSMDEETLFSLVAVGSDPDLPAETLSWSLESGPGTALAGGYYIYTPDEADGPGVYPVTLRVTDSGTPSLSDTVSFTVTVAEVNVAPVVAPSSFVAAEGGVLSRGPEAGVLAGAFDAEGNAISALLDVPPVHGSLTLLADGSFTYTHDGSENHLDGFSFTATDGMDSTAPISVTIAVDPVNDAPTLSGAVLTPSESTPVGTGLGTVTASDAEGDSLVFAFTTPTSLFTIDALTGEIRLAASLDFEAAPSHSLTVAVTDTSGASDAVDVVVNVTDFDELPVVAPAAFPVVEDQPVGSTVGTVSAFDPEGEAVSFAIVGGDPAAQFTIDPSSGELILIAELDAAATPAYLLDITVADPAGNVTPTAVIVIVNPAALLPPVNAFPLGIPDLITLNEDTSVIVSPLANDSDPDGDPLLVTWIDLPANGTLRANGDGTYTYRPAANFNGRETLNYGVSDGRGGLATSTVVLAIVAVNDPPVAPNHETVLEFTSEIEIPIPGGVFDPDGDPVQVAIGTISTGTVTLTDGSFTYVPPPEWNGTDTFTYRVTDDTGSSSTGVITVRVTQIDGGLVAIDLVSVEDVGPPTAAPSSGIVVDRIKLLVGTVAEMAGLLGIPLLAVGVAFLGSILFGLSRNFVIGRGPVYLPATAPGNVAVVRLPAGAVLTALEGPGDEFPVVHRYEPAETGIRTTGRLAQRGSTGWIEVETPEGDAWVIDRFLTPLVPAGAFAADDRVAAAVDALRRVIAARSDLTPLASKHGLEVAYYASPKHFGGDDLRGLLDGDASWGWWDPTGSTPSVRGEFFAIVADPLAESLEELDGRAIAEAVVEIPVELVNFANLTFNEPDRLGWRVFFEYEGDEPKLAAIWREGVTNPAAI